MPLTKTTTRAFAASLAMVAAGGTIAGAAVFHHPIFGLGSTDAASANVAPATVKHAVRVARPKVHRKVVVKTRYADVVVHVPAPAARTVAAAATETMQPPAPTVPPTVSTEPDDSEPEVSEPEATTTTTSPSTTTTVGEHDDEGEHEDDHESDDVPDVGEHEDGSSNAVEQP